MNLEQLQAMSNDELDALTAPIMGYIYQNAKLWEKLENGKHHWVRDWNPTTDMNDAMELANKMGIALIPQSSDTGFRWYACDVESVSYRGSEIAIRPIDETGISEESAPIAITIASILAKG